MFKKLRERLCKHDWRPLRVEYRYKDIDTGKQMVVKRCQCDKCGKIDNIHFRADKGFMEYR